MRSIMYMHIRHRSMGGTLTCQNPNYASCLHILVFHSLSPLIGSPMARQGLRGCILRCAQMKLFWTGMGLCS